MANRVVGINPEVLRWARRQSGKGVDEVASTLGKSADDVRAWEEGEASPTYIQLEKLAYQVYKRPIAVFFFPEPPEEEDPEHAFRTLPETEIDQLEPDTRYRFREARAYQLSLGELCFGRNPASRRIFEDLRVDPLDSPQHVAAKVREYLGVSLEEAGRWSTAADALRDWRISLETVGIFVFKGSLKQKGISGFCLYDPEFPIIYINNSTPKTRQIFTLFHELGHILLQESGIAKTNDDFIRLLNGKDEQIEVFCNRFAADVIAPMSRVESFFEGRTIDDASVAVLARELAVSREVVLRRLLDLGRVSREDYEARAEQWARDYLEGRSKPSSGGNYYATKAAYLGTGYMDLAFRRYHEGSISMAQLADFLDVKITNVQNLETVFLEQRHELEGVRGR